MENSGISERTKGYENLTKLVFYLYWKGTENMSKSLITDKEYRRFENIIYRLWYVYEFGQGKSVRLTEKETQRLKQTLSQLKQKHPREHDIILLFATLLNMSIILPLRVSRTYRRDISES